MFYPPILVPGIIVFRSRTPLSPFFSKLLLYIIAVSQFVPLEGDKGKKRGRKGVRQHNRRRQTRQQVQRKRVREKLLPEAKSCQRIQGWEWGWQFWQSDPSLTLSVQEESTGCYITVHSIVKQNGVLVGLLDAVIQGNASRKRRRQDLEELAFFLFLSLSQSWKCLSTPTLYFEWMRKKTTRKRSKKSARKWTTPV